jgi:hypothetical protein
MQVPVHAVLQHTPWTQSPLAHSPPAPHMAPSVLSPHEPPLQTPGDAQSASDVHVDLQAPVPQLNGKHDVAAGTVQVPAPSQLPAGVNVVEFAGQEAGLHCVPCAWFWQAPAWHRPLAPQVFWSL